MSDSDSNSNSNSNSNNQTNDNLEKSVQQPQMAESPQYQVKIGNYDKILLLVKNMLNDIHNDPEISMLKISNREEYKNRMIKKYGQLRAKSETLFDMIVNNRNFDYGKLKQMLELIKQHEHGNMSYNDTSVAWGQINFNQYVKPVSDKLDDKKE